MASLAASAVSDYPTDLSRTDYPAGKGNRNLVRRQLKLTLTGQGGATNTIPASALGFATLVEVSVLWDATNSKGYPAVIDPVNNIVILLDGSAAPAPVDVTTTAAYITVTGTPTASIN
jgi:hypothetical protein